MTLENLDQEIEIIERELVAEREKLNELEAAWKRADAEYNELRDAVEHLRAAVEGRELKTPSSTTRVDRNPDTGRPARGARRDQMWQICRRLGRGQKTFRTRDVLHKIREIEGEVSDGVRSYTYAVMKTFHDEGLVDKVGRGKWKLT